MNEYKVGDKVKIIKSVYNVSYTEFIIKKVEKYSSENYDRVRCHKGYVWFIDEIEHVKIPRNKLSELMYPDYKVTKCGKYLEKN